MAPDGAVRGSAGDPDLAGLYRATATPARVDVPQLQCLMVDGAGDPETTPAYADAVGTLYAVSYGLRFMAKAIGEQPWKVGPLEGLWWADDPDAFLTDTRAEWRWTMLIVQPTRVTADLVGRALDAAVAKGRAPAAEHLHLDVLDEGTAFQVLHVGPYDAEGPTIAGLHRAIAEQGYALRGAHHEIYLGDPRRSAPERLRTIIRQPVQAPEDVPQG
ncbi:GyrI-like domain-containing protein [Cellulomonas sp. 73-145]|mgnify:CR=1 FL=1|uniref:GyrI-like domain-containing protein n=1 Tax=Cellulomonas sp. 73-145 TaxID=1895739 RepID=UPI000A8AAAEF|nr:GyrI-like domain-containing protein [Cellulomonas sp. 73-145]